MDHLDSNNFLIKFCAVNTTVTWYIKRNIMVRIGKVPCRAGLLEITNWDI